MKTVIMILFSLLLTLIPYSWAILINQPKLQKQNKTAVNSIMQFQCTQHKAIKKKNTKYMGGENKETISGQ